MHQSEHPDKIIWLNGSFMPVTEARISPLDRGFLYGDGLFETIRGEYGTPLYLSSHIERILSSAKALKLTVNTDCNWPEIFREILVKNDYADKVSRLKLVISRGVHHGLDLRDTDTPTILLYANSYTIPEKKYKNGWKLHVIRGGYAPRLAKLKSLNYLYYLDSRQEAIDANADDALIMDTNEEAAETATGSLMFRTNGEWWMPSSEYQLPGLARTHIISILKEQDQEIEQRPASMEAMLSAETIWVTNSMIGVMPISELSGYPVKEPLFEEAAKLRSLFVDRGRKGNLTLLS
jgi:branched-chain amino acid aminotransferase